MPGEVVDRVGVEVEAVGLHRPLDGGQGFPQAGTDPTVREAQSALFVRRDGRRLWRGMHQDEARRVPELVAEVPVALHPRQIEIDVAARRGQGAKRETQRVRAIGGNALRVFAARRLLDARRHLRLREVGGAFGDQRVQRDAVHDVEGVQAVAPRLGHLGALGVAHQAVDIDGAERHVAGEAQRHHNHPRHPEEDDVVAGHQDIRGVEALKIGRSRRPAQGGEGPQCGAEPGVEHIRVLGERRVGGQTGASPRLGLVAPDMAVAVRVVPCGNAVAGPLLAADAPVLHVAHPRKVGVLELLWHEADAAFLHRGDGRLGQWLDRDPPLIREPRLQHRAGTVAARHHHLVLLHGFEQAQRVQVLDHGIPGGEAVHAAVSRRRRVVYARIRVEDVHQCQPVALAHLVVVEVVRRCDLHATGAELRVHMLVRHDGQFAPDEWQPHRGADQAAIAFILGVYRHAGVAEQGLRARRGHHQMLAAVRGAGAVGQRIADVPQVAGFLRVLHLQVRNGGAQGRVPVHQALFLVDEAGVVEPHEHFPHGDGKALVHGEAGAAPVHRSAHAPHLAGDFATGLAVPAPHPLDERLAADVRRRHTFRFKLPLHQHLRGDGRVVGAHLPERCPALHAPVPDQRVHQRLLEGVTQVQPPGDVRRRNGDAIGRGVSPCRLTRRFRGEPTPRLPFFVEAPLHGEGVVVMVHARAGRGAQRPSQSSSRSCENSG